MSETETRDEKEGLGKGRVGDGCLMTQGEHRGGLVGVKQIVRGGRLRHIQKHHRKGVAPSEEGKR